jgi:hypothetical protein
MDIPVEKIISTFLKIRSAKEELTRGYEAQVAELDEQMTVLKQKLLEVCKDTGVTSLGTGNAIAYRTVKNRYWTNDWSNFYNFLKDKGKLELLEKRIHQTNMKEFLEEHPDTRPPGLNIDSEYDITIKRR